MITAIEARELLKSKSNYKVATELKSVEDSINKAISNGNSEIWTKSVLDPLTVFKLKDLGYKVAPYDNTDHRDNYVDVGHIVSWK